jgi:hypothetical protein
MKLLGFETYRDYVAAQTRVNKQKLASIWASDRELRAVARYVRKHIPHASFGLCHGVRNGYEVETLRRLLGIEVLGTEISDTADLYPHVIQWDFHEIKPEWIENTDFIYSNSWDHSFDPALAIDRWMSCLRPDGRLFLSWTAWHAEGKAGDADCFGASLSELLELVRRNHEVETVLALRDFLVPVRNWTRNLWVMVSRALRGAQFHLVVARSGVRSRPSSGSGSSVTAAPS